MFLDADRWRQRNQRVSTQPTARKVRPRQYGKHLTSMNKSSVYLYHANTQQVVRGARIGVRPQTSPLPSFPPTHPSVGV